MVMAIKPSLPGHMSDALAPLLIHCLLYVTESSPEASLFWILSSLNLCFDLDTHAHAHTCTHTQTLSGNKAPSEQSWGTASHQQCGQALQELQGGRFELLGMAVKAALVME